MLGAFTVHWPNGWYFAAPNGGWEYIAVLVAALLVQAGLGDGRLALAATTDPGRKTTSGIAAGLGRPAGAAR
jgi:putative oxidoreductase